MGWGYRKSYKVGGVRINVGKRGVTSVSAGGSGLRYTVPTGRRASKPDRPAQRSPLSTATWTAGQWRSFAVLIGLIAVILIAIF